jgi:hypothetical protein
MDAEHAKLHQLGDTFSKFVQDVCILDTRLNDRMQKTCRFYLSFRDAPDGGSFIPCGAARQALEER